jgi:DNA-binding winged helix-turn-helix (wHTH) protein
LDVEFMGSFGFGPFVLNPESRVLLKDGEPVVLTAKVLDTLIFLVQRHGTTTRKDELLTALWPDTTVEEANLTQNISTLRRVLGDDPKDPRYIATRPGRGYSFIATVTEIPIAHQPRLRGLAPGFRVTFIAVLMALAVTGTGGVIFRYLHRSSVPESRTVPFTTYPGVETMPAFSPDGQSPLSRAWSGDASDPALAIRSIFWTLRPPA